MLPGIPGKADVNGITFYIRGPDDLDLAFFIVVGPGISPLLISAEKSCYLLEGLYRRRQGKALKLAGEADHALHGRDQVCSPFGADHGMDLVQDERGDSREHGPAASGAQDDIQALGRRDKDFRRFLQHLPPLFGWGVSASRENADVRKGLARIPEICS